MHSILLVLEQPASHYSPNPNMREEDRYRTVVTKMIELSKKNTNIQLLGDNVLLISINKASEPLLEVFGILSNAHYVSYKYTIFDEDLSWYESTKEA